MRLRHYATVAKEALGMTEDLAALAVLELQAELGARVKYLLALAVAAILAVIGFLFAGVLLLVLAWDSPYRLAAAIGLALAPFVVSACIVVPVMQRWRSLRWLPATRNESREICTWLKSKL